MSRPTDRGESITKEMFPCRDRNKKHAGFTLSHSAVQLQDTKQQDLRNYKTKTIFRRANLLFITTATDGVIKKTLYFLTRTAKRLRDLFNNLLKTFKANYTNIDSRLPNKEKKTMTSQV